MGSTKQYFMEMQEAEYEEERAEWIRERLGDAEADEDHPDWATLEAEYDDWLSMSPRDFGFDEMEVEGYTALEIFGQNLAAASELLTTNVSPACRKSLHVMLHAHVVTALEAYLSTVFTKSVLSEPTLMRRLVETDPAFAKQSFTLKEIYAKQENMKEDLKKYLQGIIFHKIAIVKNLYLSVLKADFGDVEWLFHAVTLRHDCVHRAGYDKHGQEVDLTKASLMELIANCKNLGEVVDSGVKAEMNLLLQEQLDLII